MLFEQLHTNDNDTHTNQYLNRLPMATLFCYIALTFKKNRFGTNIVIMWNFYSLIDLVR